jgi:uncharacterized protein (DUF305 family)
MKRFAVLPVTLIAAAVTASWLPSSGRADEETSPAPLRAHVSHQHEPSDQTDRSSVASPASFDEMMHEAMTRMDSGMSIRDSGDPDRDFAAMMIPHHQGAIDMAKAELQFGRDPVLRRLAQGIIVEQQQEIELMRRHLQRVSPSPQREEK